LLNGSKVQDASIRWQNCKSSISLDIFNRQTSGEYSAWGYRDVVIEMSIAYLLTAECTQPKWTTGFSVYCNVSWFGISKWWRTAGGVIISKK
jgi:hypothetical protein